SPSASGMAGRSAILGLPSRTRMVTPDAEVVQLNARPTPSHWDALVERAQQALHDSVSRIIVHLTRCTVLSPEGTACLQTAAQIMARANGQIAIATAVKAVRGPIE